MFRKTVIASLIALATPVCVHAQAAQSPEAPASQDAKMQEARAIIAVMFPPEQRDQKMHGMMVAMIGQMRGSLMQLERINDPGLDAIVNQYVDALPDELMPITRKYFPSILEATAQAYAHEFSLDELKQIHAFAETPAGAHYFDKAPTLLSDPAIAQANEQYLSAVQTSMEPLGQKLRKKIGAYIKAHPDVLKKLQHAKR